MPLGHLQNARTFQKLIHPCNSSKPQKYYKNNLAKTLQLSEKNEHAMAIPSKCNARIKPKTWK